MVIYFNMIIRLAAILINSNLEFSFKYIIDHYHNPQYTCKSKTGLYIVYTGCSMLPLVRQPNGTTQVFEIYLLFICIYIYK